MTKSRGIYRPAGYWDSVVLPHAATIVNSYTTGVTLRQLYYRLVADGTIRNTKSEYNQLARRSAEARVEGTFPDLIDTRHDIERPTSFTDPKDGLDWLVDVYRRDRTEGQPYSIYIGNEKTGQSAQLRSWFGDRGIPVVTIGGWASTPFVQQVSHDIIQQPHPVTPGWHRPAVLIYAGDFDPSGAYIGDDFAERVGMFSEVIRVGVNATQIAGLPANPTPPKVADDPRAGRFLAEFGTLVQYELDAFSPDDLRALYEAEVANWWDEDAYKASLAQEAIDIANLKAMLP